MPIRLFLALDVDEKPRGRLIKTLDLVDMSGTKVRTVKRDNLHVTMNFLGDVEDSRIVEVCRAVSDVAGETKPFDFSLVGLKCVPSDGRILRMIWCGVKDASGGMGRLYENLSAALETLDFPRERRPFSPHITLARFRYVEDPAAIRKAVEAYAETDFGTTAVGKVVVYSSELTRSGPIYTPASNCLLKT